MPMIQAPVVQAVQQLLQERGIEKRVDERFGDYVARGLNITSAQAERFIEALHEGKTLEEARAEAGVTDTTLLTDIARAVGSALGKAAGLAGKSSD
jgi:hypothetical protein